jgi:uncharacterized tellurite resistance protein B-like protein
VTNNRETRGFDVARMRVALSAFTMPSLRAILEAIDEATGGVKDELVRRVARAIDGGATSPVVAFAAASKDELQRACRSIDADDRGTVNELIYRLDRAVRYSALGDATVVSEDVAARLTPGLGERERLLALELHARLRGRLRGVSRFTLGELIGRLGRRRAEQRARGSAAREVGDFLWTNGIATEPDLRAVDASPGINSDVVVRLREEWGDDGSQHQAPETTPVDSTDEVIVRETDDDVAISIAELGMFVSRSDRIVHESEVAKVRAHAVVDARSPTQRTKLLALVERLRESRLDAAAAARLIAARLDIDARSRVMEHLFDIAMADGVIVREEQDVLRWLNDVLQPHPGLFDQLMADYMAGAVTPSSLREQRSPYGGREGDSTDSSQARTEPAADPIDDIITLLFSTE